MTDLRLVQPEPLFCHSLHEQPSRCRASYVTASKAALAAAVRVCLYDAASGKCAPDEPRHLTCGAATEVHATEDNAPLAPLASAMPSALLGALNIAKPGEGGAGSGGGVIGNPMAPTPREVIDPAKLATNVSAQGSKPYQPAAVSSPAMVEAKPPASGTKPKGGKGKRRRR